MPCTSEQQRRQLNAFAEMIDQTVCITDEGHRERWNALMGAHDVLCLGLGAEIGFFERRGAEELIRACAAQLRDTFPIVLFGGAAIPGVGQQRLVGLLGGNMESPLDRPPLNPSDGVRIAFRQALLVTQSLRQDPAALVGTLLARARFADDWDAREGSLGMEGEVVDHALEAFKNGASLDLMESATETLLFLDEATACVSNVDAWAPDDPPQRWFRTELALLFQIHADTTEQRLKDRLLNLAKHLAAVTASTSERMIVRAEDDPIRKAALMSIMAQHRIQWRSDAIDIVNRYDAALPAFA